MTGHARMKITKYEKDLRYELDILKLKFADELGHDEKIEVTAEEKNEIDELKVRKKAKEFNLNIHKVYVTFAKMKTKLALEKHF